VENVDVLLMENEESEDELLLDVVDERVPLVEVV
jgi:hypothetical protein